MCWRCQKLFEASNLLLQVYSCYAVVSTRALLITCNTMKTEIHLSPITLPFYPRHSWHWLWILRWEYLLFIPLAIAQNIINSYRDDGNNNYHTIPFKSMFINLTISLCIKTLPKSHFQKGLSQKSKVLSMSSTALHVLVPSYL